MTLKHLIADAFSRAAETYDALACVQKTAGMYLLNQLTGVAPDRVLDIGCGSGWLTRKMAIKFPAAMVWALDLAPGMVQHVKETCPEVACSVLADMENLPFRNASFDLVYSNFAMQWLDNPEVYFRECYRLLPLGGHLVCSTLLPGTLAELQNAWASVDNNTHINRFLPAGQVVAAAERAGFKATVEAKTEVVYYPEVVDVLRALKGIGASTLTTERHASGLSGRHRLRLMLEAYEGFRTPQGIPATYEILYCTLKKLSE